MSRRARRVACQAALASFEELLGPAVVHRGCDALAAAQFGDILLTAQPFQHNADFLFRRVVPACLAPNVLHNTRSAPCGYKRFRAKWIPARVNASKPDPRALSVPIGTEKKRL